MAIIILFLIWLFIHILLTKYINIQSGLYLKSKWNLNWPHDFLLLGLIVHDSSVHIICFFIFYQNVKNETISFEIANVFTRHLPKHMTQCCDVLIINNVLHFQLSWLEIDAGYKNQLYFEECHDHLYSSLLSYLFAIHVRLGGFKCSVRILSAGSIGLSFWHFSLSGNIK